MRILVIANVHSGKGKAAGYLPLIKSVLKPGNELKVYITTPDTAATVAFVRAHCRDFDMLVVLGGDGTLHEVINGYVPAGCSTPIGYVPTGSTNDFASSLKLECNPEEACRRMLKMNTRTIDTACFNGEYFTYVAAAGAFSATSYKTTPEMKKKLGYFAYVLGGIGSLPTTRPIHMRVTVGDKTVEDEYLIAMISNSVSIGGIFSFEETLVSLDDGLLEVLLLKEPEDMNEFGSVLKDVLVRNYNGDYITFMSGAEIIIESPTEIPWSLDGEYGGSFTKTVIRNIPNALNLLI